MLVRFAAGARSKCMIRARNGRGTEAATAAGTLDFR